MPRTAGGTPIASLAIEPRSPLARHRQLYDVIRQAILSGHLRPGRRLPSTRRMAEDVGVSRNTVLSAFDQLLAEGYLEGKPGSGTYVTRALPDEAQRPTRAPAQRGKVRGRPAQPSRRSREPAGIRLAAAPPVRAFATGPALDLFPTDLFARIAARRWRRARSKDLDYGEAGGYRPLREAVATYLGEARAVRCDAEQVLIVNGAQQALSLAGRVLADPGDLAWVEDPGYFAARRAFEAAGLRLAAVPLDADGLDVRAGSARGVPRLVYVSPSHQYPLGVTMSLGRRLELIEHASRCGSWILEDDYDSEYRYASRPLASLQGLDGEGRVVYVGTFSKVLAPSIRLGYVVVPPALVDVFLRARWVADRHSSTLEQHVIAEFIQGGHFERHIRRMRTAYAERQEALLQAARRHLDGLVEVAPSAAGLHLVGWLPRSADDGRVAAHAAAAGVETTPLSPMAVEARVRPALLLGYAAHNVDAIRRGARELAAVLATARVSGASGRGR